jgi:hypothetical protein
MFHARGLVSRPEKRAESGAKGAIAETSRKRLTDAWVYFPLKASPQKSDQEESVMPSLRPRVIAAQDPGEDPQPISAQDQQGPLAQVVKWIPIEVIAFYEAVMAAITDDKSDDLRLWLSLAGLVICGLWIAFATKPESKGYAWRQIILAILAFGFWAIGVQSEVMHRKFGWPAVASTLTLLFGTMLLPIFDGILTKLGVPQNK